MKKCPMCKISKHETEFWKSNSRRDGLNVYCKDCGKQRIIDFNLSHPNRRKENRRRYYVKNRKKCLEWGKKEQRKIKTKVLSFYSKSQIPYCSICNFKDIRALSIDHINGGGAKHRKELGRGAGGYKFYKWLITNNFPKGFRVLCMNCQFIEIHKMRNPQENTHEVY